MWAYQKKLEYPVKIANPNPAYARIIVSQLGGPDGEMGAAARYLNQRYAMPYKECKGILTDVGTEELAHEEIIAAILFQLTRNMTPEDIWASGFESYFVDHTAGVYPQDASGTPFNAATLQSTGDAITDLFEDLAAEQKARTTYDNILRLVDDPDVRDPIKFLREREIVHFQRFGDALQTVQSHLDAKNYYAFNPSFDMRRPMTPGYPQMQPRQPGEMPMQPPQNMQNMPNNMPNQQPMRPMQPSGQPPQMDQGRNRG